ncbi:MAG: phosphodiester glycosidase family protein [Akkermansiaceae bacterium]|nr:phosphodiester glycosidase family protein [Akkermansiaceae bacterium]
MMQAALPKPLAVMLGLAATLLVATADDGLTKAPAVLSVRLQAAPGADQPAPVVGWSESLKKPRPLRLHFLRIDLTDSRIEPCVVLADDPDGPGPAEAKLTRSSELANRTPGLLAAVNANAFAHLATATPAERKRGWFAGKSVDIQGLAAADGRIRSEPQAGRISFWFDAAKQPHLGPPTATGLVRQGVADWGELLLTGGKVVAKPASVLHPRTLAGFDPARHWLLLVVVDGRQPGTSEGMSLPEAAVLMQQHACSEAINLDGGGSSILLQKQPDTPGFTIINHPSDGVPRPLPVMLGVRQRN